MTEENYVNTCVVGSYVISHTGEKEDFPLVVAADILLLFAESSQLLDKHDNCNVSYILGGFGTSVHGLGKTFTVIISSGVNISGFIPRFLRDTSRTSLCTLMTSSR